MLALLSAIRNRFFAPRSPYQYRVIRICGGKEGFEPQMSYTMGRRDGVKWFPLNRDGFWLEPDAFNEGEINQSSPMSEYEAKRSILRARAINQQHIQPA